MRFRSLLRLLSLFPLFLAACGDLPEPFLGNPGATARRLAVPDTPMLAVQPTSNALLSPQGDADFRARLAEGLQNAEIPTLARKPERTDWRLAVTASQAGDQVVPHYAIVDPSGHQQGTIDGPGVAAPGWSAGAPWVLTQAAKDAVPKVLSLMMSIRATRDRADPNSLMHRVAKVYVPEVSGAPGDGDTMLSKQIRAQLAQLGPLVQLTPEGADFTAKGEVLMTAVPKGQQRVEVTWTVTRPSGAFVGKVSQLNSVPAGSLNLYWGDVAVVVAQEAAGGIDTVVERFIGRDAPAPGAATTASSPSGTPAARTAGSPTAQSATTPVARPGAPPVPAK
jgi:hypothetical protein